MSAASLTVALPVLKQSITLKEMKNADNVPPLHFKGIFELKETKKRKYFKGK